MAKCCGSRPHAYSVHMGAPEPPENLDHCETSATAMEEARHTHHVLVRVHEDVETILFRLPQHGYCVVYPLFVVLAWPCMFYGLPCEDISYCIVAPAPQACEVCGGVVHRERPVDKGDIVAVEEAVRNMRGQIWGCGELGVGGAIDAMECDLAVLGIAERPPVDTQPHLRHGSA